MTFLAEGGGNSSACQGRDHHSQDLFTILYKKQFPRDYRFNKINVITCLGDHHFTTLNFEKDPYLLVTRIQIPIYGTSLRIVGDV